WRASNWRIPRRASGSSSAMTARILSVILPPDRKTHGCDRSTVLSVSDLNFSSLAKECFQTRAGISKTDPGIAAGLVSSPIILHDQDKIAVHFARGYFDDASFGTLRYAMPDRVFHQGLQNEFRYERIANLVTNYPTHLKPV